MQPDVASPADGRVVVVGGGIAGLTAAYRLLRTRPDLQVTVLEGSPAVGGKLLLGEVGGIQVDLGAESMLNRRPEATSLAREVGLEDDVVYPVAQSAGVWTRGRISPLPPSLMGVPADPGAAVRSGVLSRLGGLRAAAERWLPAPELHEDVAVGRFVARRLGTEVRDRLVEPLLGGVYAGHADELSLRATVPQLATGYAEHGGLLAATRATISADPQDTHPDAVKLPVFAGVRGGVGRLAEATANAVQGLGGQVRTTAMVRELHREAGDWRLVVGPTREPEQVQADAVVLAIPAAPASRLLRTVSPVAAAELAGIEYASMAIVTLAWPADAVHDAIGQEGRLTGSGFLVPPVEGRAIKASTYSSLKWEWLADDVFVLRCSIGRHREEATLQRDDAELVDLAVADLADAVGLHGPMLDARVTRWGGALPQYAVGHVERSARIRSAVAEVPGLAVCGAAYDGVGIPAVIGSADAAATQVIEHLGARGTMAP